MGAVVAFKTEKASRAEWLAARRAGIGGSDLAAVNMLSPWSTPLQVYLSKVDGVEAEENDAMRYGRKLEDFVASEYVERTGDKVRRVNAILRSEENPVMQASLDRQIVNGGDRGPGVLEIKTVGRVTDEWGPDGSDLIPDYYAVQVQHYLGVTGYSWGRVAAFFFASRELRVYEIARDDELISLLWEPATRFWADHVVPRVPPPPMTAGDVIRLFPRSSEAVAVASPEIEAKVRELREIKARKKEIEALEESLSDQIRAAFGEAGTLVSPDGSPLATFKSQSSTRLDSKAVKAAHPAVFAACSVTSETRVLRLK